MLFGSAALDRAHGQDVPPTGSLHLVSWIQRVRNPIRFEFKCIGRVNVLDVKFIVSDIGYFVLLQLLWLRPVNIAQVHIVPPLDLLLFSVSVGNGTINISNV